MLGYLSLDFICLSRCSQFSSSYPLGKLFAEKYPSIFFGPHVVYYKIRLGAPDFYRVIDDEGAARINYRAIEIESE